MHVTERFARALSWRVSGFLDTVAGLRARRATMRRWRRRGPSRPHALPGELVVSLTSYPPRFPDLHLTLRCLLDQSVRPDRVVLWIAETDLGFLPRDVTALRTEGLHIRGTRDLGPYKKIVPTLEAFPGAFVVTADDDVCYPREWLSRLQDGWDGRRSTVVCLRAHVPTFGKDGLPSAYAEWNLDVREQCASHTVFPTGSGGVLYPPGSLAPAATDQEAFQALCPRADDIWLYWMGRMAGSTYRKVGRTRLVCWDGSQAVALFHENLDRGNDVRVAAMIERYGNAFAAPASGLFGHQEM